MFDRIACFLQESYDQLTSLLVETRNEEISKHFDYSKLELSVPQTLEFITNLQSQEISKIRENFKKLSEQFKIEISGKSLHKYEKEEIKLVNFLLTLALDKPILIFDNIIKFKNPELQFKFLAKIQDLSNKKTIFFKNDKKNEISSFENHKFIILDNRKLNSLKTENIISSFIISSKKRFKLLERQKIEKLFEKFLNIKWGKEKILIELHDYQHEKIIKKVFNRFGVTSVRKEVTLLEKNFNSTEFPVFGINTITDKFESLIKLYKFDDKQEIKSGMASKKKFSFQEILTMRLYNRIFCYSTRVYLINPILFSFSFILFFNNLRLRIEGAKVQNFIIIAVSIFYAFTSFSSHFIAPYRKEKDDSLKYYFFFNFF